MSKPAWDHELDEHRDCYEDALFRVAMLELEIEETEKFIADIESERTHIGRDGMNQEINESRPKVYALIERELRREKMKRFVRLTLPRTGIAAACVIAILSIGAITAFAASSTVRMKVLELLINIQDKYTEVSLAELEGSEFHVPAEWTGEYFPSLIPEGYLLDDIDSSDGWREVLYRDDNRNRLIYIECEAGSVLQLNTEGADVDDVEIHGVKAVCSYDGKTTELTWSEHNRLFLITFDGSKDKAIEIASSVRKIN